MSSQLRFEGNDLEDLLERVRSEVGEDARIVAANKLRKGGVGGFFARELFEVIVEPPVVDFDEAQLRPAARLGRNRRASATEPSITMATRNDEHHALRPNQSVLDLVDEVELHEQREQIRYEQREHTRHQPRDQVQAQRAAVEPPSVSTQTERFAQILQRLAVSNDGPNPAAAAAPQPPVRIAGFDDISIIDDDDDDIREPIDTTMYRRSAAAPKPQSQSQPMATPITEPSLPKYAPKATLSPDRHDRYEREIAAAVAPSTFMDSDDLIERPERVLVKLGVPARFVPRGVSGTAMRASLVESLERLPECEPLPESRGVTVAIVGIGARPVALARILAAEQGIDPDTVVIATERELGNGVPPWLQITDGVSAQERRRSWRRRDHVSFVAVSVPSITAATEWTNEMLDHLEPTQVWAVASAGWKADDVHAWAQRLGGFDVLAVERLDETVSPASLLEIGIPVSRIEGEPANAMRWADVLLDRVVVQ